MCVNGQKNSWWSQTMAMTFRLAVLPSRVVRATAVTSELRREFSRGSSGQGWYKKFQDGGEESFVKYAPPTPFDWSKSGKTSKVFFDFR
jgi:hypothetical protein